MCIALVRVRSVGVDVSIARGILMFIWAKPKAELSCFLSGPRADMSIALVRVRSVGVDVSIARGILMFIWG